MKNFVVVAILMCLAFSSIGMASELPRWQLDGSSNAFLSITHSGGGSGDTTELNLGTHAFYFLNPSWEVGAYFLFTHTSPDNINSSTQFRLVPSVEYNFADTPLNSFFVRGGLGLYTYNSASSHSYSALGFIGSVGKRFPISSSVTWTPELSISGHTQASDDTFTWFSSTAYELTLFQFTVFLD